MNRFRKLLALVTVVGLLLTLWAPVAVSAAPAVAPQEDLLYFGRSILTQMNNSQALCYAYDRLVEGLANQDETIDVSHTTYKLGRDEAGVVYDMVTADHPEFFYLYNVSYGGGSYVNFFYPNYQTEFLSYKGLVEHRVAVLTRDLAGKSDYEKSIILHDRVCDMVKYNLDSQHNQTVVSSLLLGESVCAGYSRAYQLLLQTVGIPSYYVVGTAKNSAGSGGHGWNLVQLDGEWYYTDVTWDDQNDEGGDIYYSYLNITYAQISTDHFANKYTEYLPRTTATANNFYVKNDLCLSSTTTVDIKKLIRTVRTIPSLQFYCPDGNPSDYVQRAFAIADELGYKITGNYANYVIDGLGMLGNALVLHWHSLLDHTYETDTTPPCECSPGTVINHCTTCGYTNKQVLAPVGHESKWEWDDTHHTYYCQHCGVVEISGEHVYDNACDADCNECNAIRAVGDHVYDDEYDPDCNECGAVREVVSSTPGDVDGNGKVNNRDLAKLQQYITGWISADEIDMKAADADGNGKINNRDLAKIQQYITGWIDTLG